MKSIEPALKDAAIDHSLPGRILVLGTVSGGILLGGLLVGGLTAAGRLAPHGVLGVAAMLFLLGCLLGALAALPLGLFGCPIGVSRRDAGRALLTGLVFVVPAIIMAAVLSGWAALASIAVYRNGPILLLTVGAAWLLGLAVVVLTFCDGLTCLQNMWLRWRSERVPLPRWLLRAAGLRPASTAVPQRHRRIHARRPSCRQHARGEGSTG
jgi:hypothetical protein